MPPEKADDEVISIEVTPNRPDLMFPDGIWLGIQHWHGKEIKSQITDGALRIENRAPRTRPFIAAAVVRGIQFTDEEIEFLMALQEKYHQTFGRKRKKVAVGIHDLDKINGPLIYRSGDPSEPFVGLNGAGPTLTDVLAKHPKGQTFRHLAQPPLVIEDADGIISFPPVLNSERTRVSTSTKNLLIEATGIDERFTSFTVALFAYLIGHGRVERVRINERPFPTFEWQTMDFDLNRVNALLGLELNNEEAEKHLRRMGHRVEGNRLLIPPYRYDMWEDCDIAEEIAISIGYMNIPATLPPLFTVGEAEIRQRIHDKLIGMGFREVFSQFLTSAEVLKRARVELAERVRAPKTAEAEYLRTWIFPLHLNILKHRKSEGLPIKLYEIGRVYGEKTKLCMTWMAFESAFEELRGCVDALAGEIKAQPCQKPFALAGRCARLKWKDGEGLLFEVHPEVLRAFGLEDPVVIFEGEIKGLESA